MFGRRCRGLGLDGRRLYDALRGGQYLLAASPGSLPATAIAGFDHVEVVPVARRTGTIALVRPDAYIARAGNHAAVDRTAEIRTVLARWRERPSHAD